MGKINPSDIKGCSWKHVNCCSYFALLASRVSILTLASHGDWLFKPLSHDPLYACQKRKTQLFSCAFNQPAYSKIYSGCYSLTLPGEGLMGSFLWFERLVPYMCLQRKKKVKKKQVWLSNTPVVKWSVPRYVTATSEKVNLSELAILLCFILEVTINIDECSWSSQFPKVPWIHALISTRKNSTVFQVTTLCLYYW